MIIDNLEKQLNYLEKKRGLRVLENIMKIGFVESFNKEAKKQRINWFAKMTRHKSFIDGGEFTLLHIYKRTKLGCPIVSLHIAFYSNHFSFVDNDYVFTEYARKKNKEFFKMLTEFKPILEKISEVIFILPKGEEENYEKRVSEIKKDMVGLKNEIKQ